ncbi:MAG TPA: hypothetical protein VNL91_10975, partial [Thermoanaerobaculia bacterium]|nr:hypothetical protein [Thermoanaerobaculia bacterium]
RQVTTVGTVLDLGPHFTVRLSAMAGKDDRDGKGTELRQDFGGPLTSTWVSATGYETERTAAKAELTWKAAWFRARAGYELDTSERTASTEILKTPRIFPSRIAQADTRDTDRGRGWLRMRIPFGARKAISIGIDRIDTDSEISTTDLENNYVTGPWDQRLWRYHLEVPILRSRGTDLALRYDGSDAATTIGAPEYDPLFDPSEPAGGVEHESRLQSAELRLYHGDAAWSAWTGIGWREEESDFEPSLAIFPGFVPSRYEIRGTSISSGGSIRLGGKGTLEGDGLWIRSRRSVDNGRIDAGLSYRHEISEHLGIGARYRYVRFNEKQHDSDDYRGHLASVFVVGRF